MCGIAGFQWRGDATADEARACVQVICQRMAKRGPDAEGIHSFPRWQTTLGHRRLAIIDLDQRANQPLIDNEERLAIVFNGEIYNFRELRATLESMGVQFTTQGDTEVLLALYQRYGAGMLPMLRGMFAFAILDLGDGSMFLARDPYGIKPLYYSQTDKGLAFASSVKALVASGIPSTTAEPAGMVGFYLWGSVPEPWTLFRDVQALPAGHCMRVRQGVASQPTIWRDIGSAWHTTGPSTAPEELRNIVRGALEDSVRAHLVSDVPISVFLSGGIDSSAIAGMAAQLGASVEGITIGFEEFVGKHEDEAPVAQRIAEHFGLRHHLRLVSQREFEDDCPRILGAMDQPSVDGVNSWFACKAAAERGYKVVLSGVGGDELLCGYTTFRTLPRLVKYGRVTAALPGMPSLLGAALRWYARRRGRPKFSHIVDNWSTLAGAYSLQRGLFLPPEIASLVGDELCAAGIERLATHSIASEISLDYHNPGLVAELESKRYMRNQLLRDSDWASMGHSLELRTPLVDIRLLDSLAPHTRGFLGGKGKDYLASAPRLGLPADIVARKKTGFGIPIASWISSQAIAPYWASASSLATPGTHWSRRWAHAAVQHALAYR